MNKQNMKSEEERFAELRAKYDPLCIERFASYDDEMFGHVFRYEDKTLGRRNLNKLFGFKKARPARECEALEWFIEGTMDGCGGRRMRDMADVKKFLVEMSLTPKDIQFLWMECGRRGFSDEHQGFGYWPVVEPHNGNWRIAWFANCLQKTEWIKYTKTLGLIHACKDE